MADEIVKKKVSELESAAALGRTDLLLVQQGNQARSLPAGDLQDYCKKGVEQYETNAKAAAEAAATAQAKAESAQKAAETAQQNAENTAAQVQNNANAAAQQAAAAVESTLAGHVSNAQAAQKAAEDAQSAAEAAKAAAVEQANNAKASATKANNSAYDAQSAADNAALSKKQAMTYSNDAANSANAAKTAAEEAKSAAKEALDGADWIATKFLPSYVVEIIPETDVFFNAVASTSVTGTAMIVEGETYHVYWHGVKYVCTCYSDGDGGLYLGDGALLGDGYVEGDYPFFLLTYDGTGYMVIKSNTYGETVPLNVVAAPGYYYNKMPEDYLPKSAACYVLRSPDGHTWGLTVDNTGALAVSRV